MWKCAEITTVVIAIRGERTQAQRRGAETEDREDGTMNGPPPRIRPHLAQPCFT